ncbi:MAG TPA: hypothetical protein VFX30_14685, partial [bacterium]|nr:hypothetical protein [bacterium]
LNQGFDVVVAEDERELISLCFDFQDELNVILFDSARLGINKCLQDGLEYSLKYAGISHVALVEWNMNDWIKRHPRHSRETGNVRELNEAK